MASFPAPDRSSRFLLTSRRREFFNALLSEQSIAPPSELQPEHADADEELSLSIAQERLWFLDHFQSGLSTYNTPGNLRIAAPINFAAFPESINEIVRRHERIRTTFRNRLQHPVQVITPAMREPRSNSSASSRTFWRTCSKSMLSALTTISSLLAAIRCLPRRCSRASAVQLFQRPTVEQVAPAVTCALIEQVGPDVVVRLLAGIKVAATGPSAISAIQASEERWSITKVQNPTMT